MKKTFNLLFVVILLAACNSTNDKDGAKPLSIEQAFMHPVESAKPWTYWYWLNANATFEGITRDLEDMAAAGIACTYMMPIGHEDETTAVDPPANPLSDHWWELVVHASKEASRLGIKIAMNACDGWALAGGPWITPELSMQEVISSKIVVEGRKLIDEELPLPVHRENYYRDIVVMAFPSLEGEGMTSTILRPKATTNIPGLDARKVVEGAEKRIEFKDDGWIQYEFSKPFTCRSVKMFPGQRWAYQLHRVEMQVSDDGKSFRSLGRLTPTKFHGWQDEGMACTHSIAEVNARYYRFVFNRSNMPDHSENHEGSKFRNRSNLSVQHIELSSMPAISQWEGKAGFRWRRSDWTSSEQVPEGNCVKMEQVIDISEKMDAEGRLNWDVPDGRWTIMRFGYTTTGAKNGPGGTGSGLECDKFNPEAAKVQFNGWFGEALSRVGPEYAGKTIWVNHTDSWEAISQNWSPLFRKEFIRLRGYDPVPWLPVMQGIPMESAELSERFLFDVRQTISDLVSENFYDPFVKLGKDRGTAFSAENIAPTMMADGLQHFKYVDFPMGEFWLNSPNQDKPNDVMDAVKGGHIYGKNIIGAEAFTQIPIHWDEDPYLLKAIGDYNFAVGINRFVLHVWAHQAFDREPGVTLWNIGTFFSGSQTWHRSGKAWFEYIHRTSSMLQQGLPVEDVCFFIGEEQPARSYLRRDLPMNLPEGYSYGCINRDALLNLAKPENGKLVMPDGLSFHVLVLPPESKMTPELAKKIGEIAEAGVPVVGEKPSASISLSGYPECDRQVSEIVNRSWEGVRTGETLEPVLAALKLLPDVVFEGIDMKPSYHQKTGYWSPPFAWNHRVSNGEDLYFLTNQEHQYQKVEVAFRITGKVPELWDASSGERIDAPEWRVEGGRTIVSMNFDPAGSVFVVFRRRATKSDFKAGSIKPVEEKVLEFKMDGSWRITFQEDRGAPDEIRITDLGSLSEHPDAGVKHFSGMATYHGSFSQDLPEDAEKILLDLGEVGDLARVWINDVFVGTAWKPPFSVDVTGALVRGENQLRVEVTNTWKNRLILDSQLPKEQRITWKHFRNQWFPPHTPLESSGLMCPLRLIIK